MAGQDRDESEQVFDQSSSVRDRTRTSYDAFLSRSSKLGKRAMQTMSDAGQSAKQIFGQRPPTTDVLVHDIDELKKVITHAHEVISNARTVLPFLFPDEVILDRTQITIVKRTFILSSNVISIRIEDVLNVSAMLGPVFGSITVTSRVMNSVDHYDVGRFWRDDAQRMKQIIQGYLIARQNGIQTDHLSCEELERTLLELSPDR